MDAIVTRHGQQSKVGDFTHSQLASSDSKWLGYICELAQLKFNSIQFTSLFRHIGPKQKYAQNPKKPHKNTTLNRSALLFVECNEAHIEHHAH